MDCLFLSICFLDTRKVYGAVVDKQHHLVHKDGRPYSDRDFAQNPQNYKATFFEKVSNDTHTHTHTQSQT